MRDEASRKLWAAENGHTYLRLTPELRARLPGPHAPDEPPAAGARHPVLRGLEETDILAYGGTLAPIEVDPSARVLLTFVPPRPAFPPEAVWSRNTKTDIPGLVLSEGPGSGRVAYLAADLDRRYARDHFPDAGHLLASLVRWTARDDIPLSVEGPGLIDCHLYRQPGRLVLHFVNLTNEGGGRGPVDELLPVGPVRVRVRLPPDVSGRALRLLVSGRRPAPRSPRRMGGLPARIRPGPRGGRDRGLEALRPASAHAPRGRPRAGCPAASPSTCATG